jgi:serine/threonine protein kinase
MFYSSYLAKFSLRDYIYSSEINILRRLYYFREVCKAVQRIHKQQICHRDLKPDNFLVFKSGYVCLSDFGTARYFGPTGGPMLSNYQGPVGDWRYTAPELIGCLHYSDHHNYCADYFSLGAILFEIFTRNILSSNIFKEGELTQLNFYFQKVPEKERINIFDNVIGSLATNRPLPSIRLFDPAIPKAISNEIDNLYMNMAHLDYRRRERDFNRIFQRIIICEKITRNLSIYERWKSKIKND